jgi:hypothetical protein
MAKRFTDLVKDVLGFTGRALEELATEHVQLLKQRGPYWDGDFEAAWEVRLGDAGIPADREKSGWSDTEASRRTITPVQIPKQPIARPIGYTIGNRMAYRAIAMDLAPDPDGKYRGDRRGRTAPRDWFETFNQGGELLQIMDKAVGRAADSTGFK